MIWNPDRTFVERLQVGDPVFILTSGCISRSPLYPSKVKKIGKLHVVVENSRHVECKFRKDNLEEAGRKFGRMYMGNSHDKIAEFSQENIAAWERQQKENKCTNIIRWLSTLKLQDAKTETLNEYHQILTQFEKEWKQ